MLVKCLLRLSEGIMLQGKNFLLWCISLSISDIIYMEKKFLVTTYHDSLRWLMNFKTPERQVARWIKLLSSFDMKIEHRSGAVRKNADGLSRIPCRQCGKVEEEADSIAACMENYQ